jgi:hypothetical protein
MPAHCRRRNEEALGYLIGQEAFAQAVEHIPLAARQIVLSRTDEGDVTAECTHAELPDQSCGQSPRQRRLPTEDADQCRAEASWIHLLEEITGGSGLQCCEYIIVVVGGAQHHYLRPRELGADGRRGLDSATRHSDLEKAYVGLILERRLHCSRTGVFLRTDDEARLLECQPDPDPRRNVIVGDQDTRRLLR